MQQAFEQFRHLAHANSIGRIHLGQSIVDMRPPFLSPPPPPQTPIPPRAPAPQARMEAE
jgi:hypothetical protein